MLTWWRVFRLRWVTFPVRIERLEFDDSSLGERALGLQRLRIYRVLFVFGLRIAAWRCD